MLGATSSRSQRAIWARSLPVRSPSSVCVRPARRRASRIRLPRGRHGPQGTTLRITQFLRPTGSDVVEAVTLVEGARGVVEHALLLALGVVRVALDEAATGLGDQIDLAEGVVRRGIGNLQSRTTAD